MRRFFDWLDKTAGANRENKPILLWLERIIFVFLILMILAAPHSIAATQIAWLIGMFVWIIRMFLKPRPRLIRTPLDIPLWLFFGWSLITSLTSYAPDISLDRMRNVLLFLIFYFVINNLKNLRAVRFLAFALIFSCMVNVVWTPIQRFIGRGVEIQGVAAESPLAKALLIEGDTLLAANGEKIKTPEDLIKHIERNEVTKVKFYRPDFEFAVDVRRENLLNGANALEKLGIASWKKSRNWRSAGFYGHYTTYAEVLQLIASLVFGLFIAAIFGKKFSTRRRGNREKGFPASPRPRVPAALLLFFCLAAMCLALLLTVTRASQLGFLVSAFVVVFVGGSRRLLLVLAAIVLPLALVGVFFLQQSRHVGFFDAKDDSTIYRQTMYRDGFRLWTENPRHFVLGVGMDSIKRYWRDWRLFDGGNLPMGHFHSTPLQLLVEGGLPALVFWLWILWIYARTLLKFKIQNSKFKIPAEDNLQLDDWQTRGIILGCFGGLIGFFTGGLVHYNLGDAEVAMVFYILMGLSIFLAMQNSKLKMQKKL
jgi:O-antigen ligase